jgi:hypothetical protein
MDKDEDKIIKVSPGKQYVRGNTMAEKRETARNVSNYEGEKRRETFDKLMREDYSPTTHAEYNEAAKKSSRLLDAYREEIDKGGYKKGGMVSMKSGGSVRGAGVAQRGQGKMRMF